MTEERSNGDELQECERAMELLWGLTLLKEEDEEDSSRILHFNHHFTDQAQISCAQILHEYPASSQSPSSSTRFRWPHETDSMQVDASDWSDEADGDAFKVLDKWPIKDVVWDEEYTLSDAAESMKMADRCEVTGLLDELLSAAIADASHHARLRAAAARSDLPGALAAFVAMSSAGTRLVRRSFTSLLKLCAAHADLANGRAVHAQLAARGLASEALAVTALANMYAKCGRPADARRVFDRMPIRDRVAWNALDAGYARNGLDEMAMEMVVRMQEEGERPDSVTLVSELPACLSLPGITLDEKKIVSSTGALCLTEIPKKMVVIGAGYIGLEIGSVWNRLGSEVTVVESALDIVPSMDDEGRKQFHRMLEKQKMKFMLKTKVVGVDTAGDGVKLTLEPAAGGEQNILEADIVLVSAGRVPYIAGIGLDTIGIETDKAVRIFVDKRFMINVKGVYAIGDAIPGPMLAHKAEEDGVACVEFNMRALDGIKHDSRVGKDDKSTALEIWFYMQWDPGIRELFLRMLCQKLRHCLGTSNVSRGR